MGETSSKSKLVAGVAEVVSEWEDRAEHMFHFAPCSKNIFVSGLDAAGKTSLLWHALKFRPQLFALEAYPFKTDAVTGDKSLIFKGFERKEALPWPLIRNSFEFVLGPNCESCIWADCYNPMDAPVTGMLKSLMASLTTSSLSHLFQMVAFDSDRRTVLRFPESVSEKRAVGMIFVIDSNESYDCGFQLAKAQLLRLCSMHTGLPLLILLNKSDLPKALSKDICMQLLGIHETASFKTGHLSDALAHSLVGDECNGEFQGHLAKLITAYCFGDEDSATRCVLVEESSLKRAVKVARVCINEWLGVDDALQWLFGQCRML